MPDLQRFASNSLAENTKQAYFTGINQFEKFYHGFQLQNWSPILPVSEVTLCFFAVFMAKSVKHDTIKAYLAAIKHLHLVHNFNLKLDTFLHLQYILRGIKRAQNTEKRTRLPITKCHLELFRGLLKPNISKRVDELMLWAAICLAFFGFLRVSELTCGKTFNPAIHLSRSDISFSPSVDAPVAMFVKVKASKTDPFKKGVLLTIGSSGTTICAVSALKNYLMSISYNGGPLFQYSDGRFLSRDLFTEEIRQLLRTGGYNANHYAGHSFRIGAATSAASANMPARLIKDLGRWTSDCYERYIRTPSETLIVASKTLVG